MPDLFQPKAWADGELLNAVQMNRLENGVEAIDNDVDDIHDAIIALQAGGGISRQILSGPSSQRPSPAIGTLYYDTGLSPARVIVGTGTSWTEINGATITSGGGDPDPGTTTAPVLSHTVTEGGTIGAINLSWTAVTGASAYTVRETESPNGVSGMPITALSSTRTPSTARNYRYWVTATVNGIESASSNVIEATLPYTAPGTGGGGTTIPVGQTTIFTDDFANLNKYPDKANPGSHSINIVNDGAGHETAVKFEVREGDDWNGSERAEVTIPGSYDVVEGDERWYEFDLKIGTPFGPVQDEAADGTVVFQWHPEDQGASPPLALRVSTQNKLRFTSDVGSQAPIDFYTVRPGVWETVVLHVKFSNSSSTGFVEVFINGTTVLSKTSRRTMSDSSNYHKFGLYRDTDNDQTDIVWFDNLRISGPPATTGGGGTPAGSNPSTFLNINGLGNGTGGWWNLGVGKLSGHVDVDPNALKTYVESPYYTMSSNGTSVQFQVPLAGGRTSTNTKYPRCELREYATGSTSTRAAWSATSGTHIMRGKSKVTHYGPVKCETVVAQIHDGSDDRLQIRAEAGSATGSQTWRLSINGTEVKDLISGVALGQEVAWEIRLQSGTLTVLINGTTQYTSTSHGYGSGNYFKVGQYSQQNTTDQANPSSEYGSSELRDLFVSHS